MTQLLETRALVLVTLHTQMREDRDDAMRAEATEIMPEGLAGYEI